MHNFVYIFSELRKKGYHKSFSVWSISSVQNTIRWRSDQLDGAVVLHFLGTPGQTKVNGDRQRETTHENCCLAAEFSLPYQTAEKFVNTQLQSAVI